MLAVGKISSFDFANIEFGKGERQDALVHQIQSWIGAVCDRFVAGEQVNVFRTHQTFEETGLDLMS